MRAVAFGAASGSPEADPAAGPLEVAFRPMINRFKGRSTFELQLVDWRPCSRSCSGHLYIVTLRVTMSGAERRGAYAHWLPTPLTAIRSP